MPLRNFPEKNLLIKLLGEIIPHGLFENFNSATEQRRTIQKIEDLLHVATHIWIIGSGTEFGISGFRKTNGDRSFRIENFLGGIDAVQERVLPFLEGRLWSGQMFEP
jgi:hypothetical protein